MPQTSEIPEIIGDSIKIGSIGTIGSLMSQELDSENLSQDASSSKKKSISVSFPTSCSDGMAQTGKIQPNEPSSRRNQNANHFSIAQKHKLKPLRHGQRTPILTEETQTDKITKRSKLGKKGNIYLVEVVDIKCNNPMSSRLKRLGFSKLSESIG